MKQRNRVLLSILACCLCLIIAGCSWFVKDPVQYNITIDSGIENGSIECDRTTAIAGETVTITVSADNDYQLVSVTVNGEVIEGNSFVMPEKDVVISATFALAADLVEAVPEGALNISAQSAGGASANAHIMLTCLCFTISSISQSCCVLRLRRLTSIVMIVSPASAISKSI